MHHLCSQSSWLPARVACGCLQDGRLECLQSTRHSLAFTGSRHSRLFLPRDQEIIIPVYLSPRRRCHSEISAGTPEASVGAARCRGCDPPALQTLSRSAFLSGLRFIRLLFKWWAVFFFLPSSCSARGLSEQMLSRWFSLSQTPTHHLLHQFPHSSISYASFTSDPGSRPSICLTEICRNTCIINALTIARLYLFTRALVWNSAVIQRLKSTKAPHSSANNAAYL